MKHHAISLHQPWAELMARGFKTVETRSWRTSYRGEVFIHAARAATKADHREAVWATMEAMGLVADGRLSDAIAPLHFGEVIAAGELLGCVRTESLIWVPTGSLEGVDWRFGDFGDPVEVEESQRPLGDFSPGRWAWLFMDLEQQQPMKVRGRQGLWSFE